MIPINAATIRLNKSVVINLFLVEMFKVNMIRGN